MEDRDRIKAWNDLWFAFSEMFKCSSRFVASICLGICINRVEKRMKPILWELTRETLLLIPGVCIYDGTYMHV